MHVVGMIAVGRSSVLFEDGIEAVRHNIPLYRRGQQRRPLMLQSAQIYWYVGIFYLRVTSIEKSHQEGRSLAPAKD